ncbi:hypothetical protein PMZ80_008106 [Knufia obscura]|uniref:Uncharacterized protein n=2 Tax=Knufia TaxID=430999 RepID=A0AAN8I6R6_9EURO|nr:hypothetical protein PMZ80_008106 [Knufia obscura]KAK5957167.1 hypothetical protein OHC33_001536 [Knufia fluminis]
MAHMIAKIAKQSGEGSSYDGDGNRTVGGDGSAGGSKNKTLSGSTILTNGTPPSTDSQEQEKKRYDPTFSKILDEDRIDSGVWTTDRLYHAWVSGGTTSPMHAARGRSMPRHDERKNGRSGGGRWWHSQ